MFGWVFLKVNIESPDKVIRLIRSVIGRPDSLVT